MSLHFEQLLKANGVALTQNTLLHVIDELLLLFFALVHLGKEQASTKLLQRSLHDGQPED